MPDTTLQIALSALAALLLSWLVVWPLRTMGPRWGFVDVPNQRSSHERPTPRAGGLAFVVVSPAVALLASRWVGVQLPEGMEVLLAGGLLVAAVGLADDRWGLSVPLRFGAYLVAASLLAAGGDFLHELQWPGEPSLQLSWVGVPVTLLWIVGLTNAYNFMDGIDGIAGTQAVVAAGTAASVALSRGDPGLALFAAVLAGGVVGFLLHNWPPARIFMGDVGSAFLGYTFAGLAVLSGGRVGGAIPFVMWLLLLGPFLFDSSLTLALRIWRGERWYEPHRQHLYQRLVRRGWSHLAVTSVYLCADLFLAGVVVAYVTLGLGFAAVAVLTAVPLLGILGLVKRVEARDDKSTDYADVHR